MTTENRLNVTEIRVFWVEEPDFTDCWRYSVKDSDGVIASGKLSEWMKLKDYARMEDLRKAVVCVAWNHHLEINESKIVGDDMEDGGWAEWNNWAPFKPRQRVVYVPTHANGDRNHPDCERGLVSSISECGKHIRVKFDKQVGKFGWEGATAQSCDPSDLIAE